MKSLVIKCCVKNGLNEYVKRGIVYHQTLLKNFTKCQEEMQILLRQRELQRNTGFICRRTILLCIHWNLLKYVVVFSLEYI